MKTDGAGREMTGRRVLFAVLFAGTMMGSLALAAFALSPGGLDAADIVVSMREGAIRVAPHFYNTVEELDRLLGALART